MCKLKVVGGLRYEVEPNLYIVAYNNAVLHPFSGFIVGNALVPLRIVLLGIPVGAYLFSPVHFPGASVLNRERTRA